MELIAPDFGLISWTLFLLLALALWILAHVDISKHSFRGPGEKRYWFGLLIVVPLSGAILYFIYGRKNRLH